MLVCAFHWPNTSFLLLRVPFTHLNQRSRFIPLNCTSSFGLPLFVTGNGQATSFSLCSSSPFYISPSTTNLLLPPKFILHGSLKLYKSKVVMAEIFSNSNAEAPTSPVKRYSQASRRRRSGLRPQNYVTGGTTHNSNRLKRQKLQMLPATVSVCNELQNAVVEDGELNLETDKKECPKFGHSSVCGLRREMEDAVAIHPSFCSKEKGDSSDLHYFGVYDGHGCSHVAMRCRDRLHDLVKQEVKGKAVETLDWKTCMETSFGRMDKEVVSCKEDVVLGANCGCNLQSPDAVGMVGSTAVVAVLTPEKIVVANCGDSRAVLCSKRKAVPLSRDHKPDLPDELKRIEATGGRVIYWDTPRVLGVLAMSRAIGDNFLKPYVSCEPEITMVNRTTDDDFLILASDGLWDVVSNETACAVTRMCLRLGNNSDQACSEASTLLTRLAMARKSSDNITVVVVDLKEDT